MQYTNHTDHVDSTKGVSLHSGRLFQTRALTESNQVQASLTALGLQPEIIVTTTGEIVCAKDLGANHENPK